MNEEVLLAEKVKLVKNLVTEKYSAANDSRLKHIQGVVKMALFLANKYGESPIKAEIAAYMHDYYKYESEAELAKIINSEDLAECQACTPLYHAYASANAVKAVAGIMDNSIYNAVRYHVFGRLNMSRLEEIILISDYTEENRPYPDCIKCREILLNQGIEAAIFYSTLYTIEILNRKGIKPHPIQQKLLEIYKEKINGNT